MSAKRIAKHVSHDLIKFARSVQVTTPYYHEGATSALEFFRQTNSPSLRKMNDSFDIKINTKVPDETTPTVRAEFLNGDVMEVDSTQYNTMQLKAMFFEAAQEAENNLGSSADKKKK